MAAALVFGTLLLLAMVSHSSGAWCVCKPGLKDTDLQNALDFACGHGGDCTPTHKNGPCFSPDNVQAHCNYAVNSYFQKKGQAAGTCVFSGTATVVTSDPSTAGCSYPTSASGTTPVTSMTPTTTNPTSGTTSPYVTNSSSAGAGGVLGGAGMGTGLGPTGVGSNNDESHGGIMLQKSSVFPFLIEIMFSGFMLFWG